jgi:hypothetical protein
VPGSLRGHGQRTGRKIFLFQYRLPPRRAGATRRYTIATYTDALTPDQDRTIATRLNGRLAEGVDSIAEKGLREATAREAVAPGTGNNGAVAEIYLERHVRPRNRSAPGYEALLRKHLLPTWGKCSITEIRRRDVIALRMVSRSKSALFTTDEVLRVLRAMFNWHAMRDEGFSNTIVRGMARTSANDRNRRSTIESGQAERRLVTGIDSVGKYRPKL